MFVRRVAAICAQMPASAVEVLEGTCVVEIKHRGFSKGTAVRELMRSAPFAKRRPIFIGDDITDQSAFAVMPHFNGLAISVRRRSKGVDFHFETPEGVRRWLDRMVTAQRRRARMSDHGLDLALIGNGRTAALLDPNARIVWWCYPRYDGDPIFCSPAGGR